jgi:hypothetical protein
MELNATEWVDKLNTMHKAAVADVAEQNATGINIHGKRYTTVARRVEVLRKNFGCYARLRIADHTDEGDVLYMRAVIELLTPSGWDVFAEGRAQEKRGSNMITKTSATEVCETSAYGRALANFGLHGGEFASANEVENAQGKQNGLKPGIGFHSPKEDVSHVPTDLVESYVLQMGLIASLDLTDEKLDEAIYELHGQLNKKNHEIDGIYQASVDGMIAKKYITSQHAWKKAVDRHKEFLKQQRAA